MIIAPKMDARIFSVADFGSIFVMCAYIPVAFERILQCLDKEKDAALSWTLSKSRNGQFSLKFWTSPNEDKIAAKKSRDRTVTSSKHCVRPEPVSLVNVDPSPDSVNSEVLERPKPIGKRRHKPPSKLNRDRRRLATWKLQQQLSRENRQAAERLLDKPLPDCSLDETPPVVLEKPAAPEPKELSKDATGSAVAHPNTVVFTETADEVVGSPNITGSSVTNCEPDSSVLDSDDECVSSVSPPLKEVPELCVACGKTEGKLFTCSKCKAVKYCGVSCQMENWSQHKFACATLKDMFAK